MRKLTICFSLTILVLLSSCTTNSDDPECDNICCQIPCYEGPFDPPWVSAYRADLELNLDIDFTHDNRVLETDHFLVFSDASEDLAKIKMGETAETALTMIAHLFDISRADLGIADLYSKIRAYSARRSYSVGSSAYTNGFIVQAFDSYSFPYIEFLPDIIEHELTHVVQFRLGGLYSQVWAWFTEGLAETISDGGPYRVIKCWQEVDEWRRESGHVNPVTIQHLEQIPDYDTIDGQRREQYYPIFGVAVHYLVDPKGPGKSLIDVKNMFADIGQGMSFARAFETHMGMSLQYYENNFYQLIKNFLPETCDEGS